jgi:hypothetical protein
VVGLVPFLVGVAFLPPSGLAVMLGCLGVAKHLGGVGRLALGAGGPLVRSGGVLVRPASTLDLLVMPVIVVAHHRNELTGAATAHEVLCGADPLCATGAHRFR